MKATQTGLAISLTLFMVACGTDLPPNTEQQPLLSQSWDQYTDDSELPEHVPGELVVVSRDGDVEAIPAVQKLLKGSLAKTLSKRALTPALGKPRSMAVLSLQSVSILHALKKIGATDKTVSPNYIYRASAIVNPNDYFFDSTRMLTGTTTKSLWGAHQIFAHQSWQRNGTGKNVLVAVVDTGVSSHADIAANIFVNPGEIPNNGGDEDVNGFIDDVRGYNFVSFNNNTADNNMHGTHVAGTIAAVGNNAMGLIGIAPEAKILPVKVLDANGNGTLSAIASGIDYAVSMGAKVINLSLGGPASTILDDAVRFAVADGAVVVVAAGNENQNANNVSPARVAEVITVAAISADNQKAAFSNFGAAVDVTAPGVSILSCLAPGIAANNIILDQNNNRYVAISGTSMATPHVAGVIANMLSVKPLLTPAQLQTMLKNSSVDLGTPGRDDLFGNGLVHTARSVDAALGVANMAPAVTAESSVDVLPGNKVEFSIQAQDPEGVIVDVSAADLPEGSSFNVQTKMFSWTPTEADAGKVFAVKFAGSDSVNKTEVTSQIRVMALPEQNTIQEPQNLESNEVAPGSFAQPESISCSASAQDFGSIAGFFLLMILSFVGIKKR